MNIHPQAIIEEGARLHESVSVGPFSWIGRDVEIGRGTVVHSHVVIKGPTQIGEDNVIYQFASVGEACQDKKYAGEPTTLVIGDRNVIRESCTLHRGTVQDAGETRIGSDNLLMAYVHVAHDCMVGSHVILANATTLAGHVHVDDWAILGGGTMVHQFCMIGQHSMCGGGSIVLRDIPAYVMSGGQPATPYGLNVEGLKRRGFSATQRKVLKRAYRALYRSGETVEGALLAINSPELLPGELEQDELQRSREVVGIFSESVRRSNRGIIR